MPSSLCQRPSAGNALENLVSSYQAICGGLTDEDTILSKCRDAISCIEKIDKENGQESASGIDLLSKLVWCFCYTSD